MRSTRTKADFSGGVRQMFAVFPNPRYLSLSSLEVTRAKIPPPRQKETECIGWLRETKRHFHRRIPAVELYIVGVILINRV